MGKLTFIVVAPRVKASSKKDSYFTFEHDRWNDHGFRTQYQLYYTTRGKNGRPDTSLIGSVKVLRRGQRAEDAPQINDDFSALGPEFCSVGGSLDYYQRMSEIGQIGHEALDALRDVILTPNLVSEFSKEFAWHKSLFRDQDDHGERFRNLAQGIVSGDYSKVAEDFEPLTFSIPGWDASIEIDTTSGEDAFGMSRAVLPQRINVLVGRNGSGKSTILSRLARVAFGTLVERKHRPLTDIGNIQPAGIGFARIVTVAFSPFDSFRLPGAEEKSIAQVAKDLEKGTGRFSFIGLRDISQEIATNQGISAGDQYGRDRVDRVQETRLKSISTLAEEFLVFAQRIRTKQRQSVLNECLEQLDRGLVNDVWSTLSLQTSDSDLRDWFHQKSTGHKITLLVIFGLVANLERSSLVLIDEPETHLHPPLLSAMMHALRTILDKYRSSALIATHSPVVLQECMARHVHVVRREESSIRISPVSIETFGESIGIITSEVFGMQSDATDFHRVLDSLIARYKSLEVIESLFKDGSMSNQARAYIRAGLAEERDT